MEIMKKSYRCARGVSYSGHSPGTLL